MSKFSLRLLSLGLSLGNYISLAIWALQRPQVIREEIVTRIPFRMRLMVGLGVLTGALASKNFHFARTHGMRKLRALQFAKRATVRDLNRFFEISLQSMTNIHAKHATTTAC